MNVTLYSNDFEQGSIGSSGNTESEKRIRTVGYIALDKTTNLRTLLIEISGVSKGIKLDVLGYSSSASVSPIFDIYWLDFPYELNLTSYPDLKFLRMVLKAEDESVLSADDLGELKLISECTWIMDGNGFPTNTEFIDVPENAMEHPYPFAMWRMESENEFPTNKLLITQELLGAFANAKNLQEVSIPKSVKKIGKYAFRNTQLKSVIISKDCEYFTTSFPENCKIKFYI